MTPAWKSLILVAYLYLGTFLIILTATCFPAYLKGEDRGREEGREGEGGEREKKEKKREKSNER